MTEQHDQYSTICKDRFDEIVQKLDKLNDKLFIDNGGDSLQTQINKNKNWIKSVTGFLTAIGLGLFSMAYWLIKSSANK